jgi:hypothetical protein
MRVSCRDLIGRHALYLPVIVVLQKLGLITCHNVAQADSPFEEPGVIAPRGIDKIQGPFRRVIVVQQHVASGDRLSGA